MSKIRWLFPPSRILFFVRLSDADCEFSEDRQCFRAARLNATAEVVCSRAKSLEPRSTRCRSSAISSSDNAISTRDKGVVADFARSCLHSAVLAVRDALDRVAARDSNAANRTNTALGQELRAMTVTIVGRRAMDPFDYENGECFDEISNELVG